jgi:hypothetical protein
MIGAVRSMWILNAGSKCDGGFYLRGMSLHGGIVTRLEGQRLECEHKGCKNYILLFPKHDLVSVQP